ncbi:MAG: dTMP kinase [Candidatus Micrarchaeia archaeon]|jgi:dTMP kinase
MKDRKGLFVVFEGLDGAGNTTQASLLESYFKKEGKKVLLTKEPTQGIIGGMIRAALNGDLSISGETLQLLFAADRSHHLSKEVEPALNKNYVVISDRYLFSSIAYGSASGLDKDWLKKINEKFRLPDISIFIDVNPNTCIKRISKNRFSVELFEREESLRKVRREYLELAKEFKFEVINGEGTIEATHKKVLEVIKKYI